MKKKRSVGVTILGVLFLVFAGHIFVSLKPLVSYNLLVMSVFYIVVILEVICGIGILCLFEWARKLVICAMFIFLLFSILRYGVKIEELSKNLPIIAAYIIALIGPVFYISIVYFFTRPEVKEQFK